MTAGDKVKIFPHCYPEQSAEGAVLIISANRRSVALSFEDPPPFCNRILADGGKIGIDRRNCKVTMLLMRESVGPWVELTGGGHYEIESD